MKYIKYFESFSFSDIDMNSKIFKRISEGEFNELRDIHLPTNDNMNDDKENQISKSDSKLLRSLVMRYISNTNLSIHKVNRYKYEIAFGISPNSDDYLNNISFYKFKDEWWLIETDLPGNVFFKGGSDYAYWIVDSTDGLIEWSNDEEWKNIKKKMMK